MKTLIFCILVFSSFTSFAFTGTNQLIKSYSFQFKIPKSKTFSIQQKDFSINQKAASKELAFKAAASECYKKLTGDKYPGDEKGLEIIDICANPKM